MGRISDQDIWNFFLNLFGGNEYASAGACGNMQAESGFYSNNCENKWNNKTGISDDEATQKINSGQWDLNYFLYDDASPPKYTSWWVNGYGWGYGLSQWTDTTRRTRLWERTIDKGIPIDDIQAQLDYITWEFTEGKWAGVRDTLSNVSSVDEAVRIYCNQYEGGTPNQSRYTYAHDFYDRFAGSSSGFPIRLHAQGNCQPYATLHLEDTARIYYAEEGTDVFIHANVGEGDYFEMWTVDSGGVTIDMETSENTFFTMHDKAVDITAHATGETPEPTPYPPEPPQPIYEPNKAKHHMPIWMYPYRRI